MFMLVEKNYQEKSVSGSNAKLKILAYDPYPANSTPLRLSDSVVIDEWEVRRVRLDDWRIVYAVSKIWQESRRFNHTETSTLLMMI